MIIDGVDTQTAIIIAGLSTIRTILGLIIFFAAVRAKNWTASAAKRGVDRVAISWYTQTEMGEIHHGVYNRHGRLAQVGLFIAFPGMFVIPTLVAYPNVMYKIAVLEAETPPISIETIYVGLYSFFGGLAVFTIAVAWSYYRTFGSISAILRAFDRKSKEEMIEEFSSK
jgi:hypothetical protein